MTRLEEYLKADVFIEMLDFREQKGNAFVSMNTDGSFTIFINTRISFEMQRQAVEHELKHIDRADFEKHDVQTIEQEARQIEQIVNEQREEVTKQLEEEPRIVQYEIEVREKLIEAMAAEGRRKIEYDGHASFGQYMWDYHRDEYLRMLEDHKLYDGI